MAYSFQASPLRCHYGTMAEMRQVALQARETKSLVATAPTTDHFAHGAQEAERAEEPLRTAMFDEMEVD